MNNKKMTLLLSLACISSSMFAMTRQQVQRRLAKDRKELEEKYGTPVYQKVVTGRGPLVPLREHGPLKNTLELLKDENYHRRRLTGDTFDKWTKAERKRQDKGERNLKDHEKQSVNNLRALRTYIKFLNPNKGKLKNDILHEEIRTAIRSLPGTAQHGDIARKLGISRTRVFKKGLSSLEKAEKVERIKDILHREFRPSRPPRALKKQPLQKKRKPADPRKKFEDLRHRLLMQQKSIYTATWNKNKAEKALATLKRITLLKKIVPEHEKKLTETYEKDVENSKVKIKNSKRQRNKIIKIAFELSKKIGKKEEQSIKNMVQNFDRKLERIETKHLFEIRKKLQQAKSKK